MNRKEYYEYIKAHNLKEEATRLARSIYGDMPKVNWTNLTDEQLYKIVKKHADSTVKPQSNKCCKKSTNKCATAKPLNECVDIKVRKALIALAELYGHKDIILKNLK